MHAPAASDASDAASAPNCTVEGVEHVALPRTAHCTDIVSGVCPNAMWICSRRRGGRGHQH